MDSIFALASAPGRAGVAVVRLSGPEAGRMAEALAGPLPPPRQAALRHLVHDGAEIAPDEASCAGVSLLPVAEIIAPRVESCASRLTLSLVPQVSAEAPTSGLVQPKFAVVVSAIFLFRFQQKFPALRLLSDPRQSG